jgi:hypothetical protein
MGHTLSTAGSPSRDLPCRVQPGPGTPRLGKGVPSSSRQSIGVPAPERNRVTRRGWRAPGSWSTSRQVVCRARRSRPRSAVRSRSAAPGRWPRSTALPSPPRPAGADGFDADVRPRRTDIDLARFPAPVHRGHRRPGRPGAQATTRSRLARRPARGRSESSRLAARSLRLGVRSSVSAATRAAAAKCRSWRCRNNRDYRGIDAGQGTLDLKL